MISRLVVAAAMLLLPASGAGAQSLSFAATTPQLVINSATAGAEPNGTTVNSSYNITIPNVNNLRIAVRLSQPLPAGYVLRVTVAAPTGATAVGTLILTTTDQFAVTALPRNKTFTNVGLTYQLSGVTVTGARGTTNYGVVFSVY